MSVIRKDCDFCGQPIELRQLGPQRWKPFNPDGTPHACPGRPAAGARPAASPSAAPASTAEKKKSGWIGLAVLAAIILGVVLLIRSGSKTDTAQSPRPAATSVATSAARSTATAVLGAVDPAEAPLDCGEFDTQMWAQTAFDDDPRTYASLDPDGDGFACEELPYGPVPALWTSRIPASAEPVRLDFTIDGDTIAITDGNGRKEHVRLVGIDTPETGKGTRPLECFGNEASDFTRDLFANAGNTVYLEYDQENRDRYDRLLRWVWFKDQRTGQVYLANEAIVRSGYAERYRNTPNRRYVNQVMDAEGFAQRHDYGLWGAC